EGDSENDHGPLANRRHYIACQIERDPQPKQRDLQGKLRVAIVPQTETNLGSVIVNGEIVRMRDEIENPMREHCGADDQRRGFCVAIAAPTEKWFVAESSYAAPKNRCNEAM